jgi:hypothetical protein
MLDNKGGVPENMDADSKLVFILDVIKRYDNYIVSTNAKASLIIAFNSLILGTVLLKFGDIISFYNSSGVRGVVGLLLVLISASSLLSLFFVFSVVYPYFGSKADDENQQNSLVYFGSVSKLNGQEYLNRLEICSIEELIKNLTVQATILARGLNSKMLKMRHSIEAITFSLVFILILVILRAAKFFC